MRFVGGAGAVWLADTSGAIVVVIIERARNDAANPLNVFLYHCAVLIIAVYPSQLVTVYSLYYHLIYA